MHLVRAEMCSLRIGRQTGAWCVPQTPQKRWNGKAPCLGGQQETIIHMEIVKQRGQTKCLTPLLFPMFDSLLGEFGGKDLFFLRLPCASSKKRCTHRTLTSSKTVWTYAVEALASLRRVHPFCSMLVKPQDSQRPYHRQPVLAVSDDMAAQSPEG